MKRLRPIRDALGRADLVLAVLTAGFGLCFMAGNALRGTDWPDADFWDPGRAGFVLILVSGAWVPLYAFYKWLDARIEQIDREAAETAATQGKRDRNLKAICQQGAAVIAAGCPELQVNDVATHIWLCRADGDFDRPAGFALAGQPPHSGVRWTRGKGVAGVAWSTRSIIYADLGPLQENRSRLGEAGFDGLPGDRRYEMLYREALATEAYTGVIGIPIFSADRERKVLAIFLIDYIGRDHFQCIVEVSKLQPFAAVRTAVQDELSPAT